MVLLGGFRGCLQKHTRFIWLQFCHLLPRIWLTAFSSVNLGGQEREGMLAVNRILDRLCEAFGGLSVAVCRRGKKEEKPNYFVFFIILKYRLKGGQFVIVASL